MARKIDQPITDGRSRRVTIASHVYDVYVGRRFYRFQDQGFGNDFDGPDWKEKYVESVEKLSRTDEEYSNVVLSTRGLRYGCFCKPTDDCHGDALADWVNAQPLAKCIAAKEAMLFRVAWLGWVPQLEELPQARYNDLVAKALEAHKAGKVVLQGEAFDPATPAGRLMLKTLSAQYERRFLAMANPEE